MKLLLTVWKVSDVHPPMLIDAMCVVVDALRVRQGAARLIKYGEENALQRPKPDLLSDLNRHLA